MDSKTKYMTEKERDRISGYIDDLRSIRAGTSHLVSEWNEIERAYMGDQPVIPGMPNTRVNILNMQVEGQTVEISENEINISVRGIAPGDELYARWAKTALDWTIRKNNSRTLLSVFARRLIKFGTAWLKAEFDPDAADGFGLVRFNNVPASNIYVDPMITETANLQKAEFIMETIEMTLEEADKLYGEKAECIIPTHEFVKDIINNKMNDISGVRSRSFTLIQRWSRSNGKLRLEEFSECGLLLYDSHKEGGRTVNQIESKEIPENYYSCVNDKYPYFAAVCYPVEGRFHGYGDGKLILRLQDMLNDLYDKIRIAARPNLILYDTNAEADLQNFDEFSFDPVPFNGDSSREPIKAVQWGAINESWWRLLHSVHQEIQRVTRYGELMAGLSNTSSSATEAAIMHRQGNRAVSNKRTAVRQVLVQACEYAAGLMMEFNQGIKPFRTDDEGAGFEWIDFDKMRNVPVFMPPQSGYSRRYAETTGKAPDRQLLEHRGKIVTKNVELDIQVGMGDAT